MGKRRAKKPKTYPGFTLIELLIVIGIIAVLATAVVVVVNPVEKLRNARNAKRASDLNEIAVALENYSADNGSYPNPGWGWRSECNGWGGYAVNDVIPGLVPKYLRAFPSDPKMNKAGNDCCYLYLSNGTDYAIMDYSCSDIGDYFSQKTLVDPTRDGGPDGCKVDGTSPWAWKISSPGGYCW